MLPKYPINRSLASRPPSPSNVHFCTTRSFSLFALSERGRGGNSVLLHYFRDHLQMTSTIFWGI